MAIMLKKGERRRLVQHIQRLVILAEGTDRREVTDRYADEVVYRAANCVAILDAVKMRANGWDVKPPGPMC